MALNQDEAAMAAEALRYRATMLDRESRSRSCSGWYRASLRRQAGQRRALANRLDAGIYPHACSSDCTPGNCQIQHDAEFGGPESRAAAEFERSLS